MTPTERVQTPPPPTVAGNGAGIVAGNVAWSPGSPGGEGNHPHPRYQGRCFWRCCKRPGAQCLGGTLVAISHPSSPCKNRILSGNRVPVCKVAVQGVWGTGRSLSAPISFLLRDRPPILGSVGGQPPSVGGQPLSVVVPVPFWSGPWGTPKSRAPQVSFLVLGCPRGGYRGQCACRSGCGRNTLPAWHPGGVCPCSSLALGPSALAPRPSHSHQAARGGQDGEHAEGGRRSVGRGG